MRRGERNWVHTGDTERDGTERDESRDIGGGQEYTAGGENGGKLG